MNEFEVIKYVHKLLERKEMLTKDIGIIEDDAMPLVTEVVLRNKNNLTSRSFEFFNRERFYGKAKYLILAELKETLDEVNAEINKLIEFKGVDE